MLLKTTRFYHHTSGGSETILLIANGFLNSRYGVPSSVGRLEILRKDVSQKLTCQLQKPCRKLRCRCHFTEGTFCNETAKLFFDWNGRFSVNNVEWHLKRIVVSKINDAWNLNSVEGILYNKLVITVSSACVTCIAIILKWSNERSIRSKHPIKVLLAVIH